MKFWLDMGLHNLQVLWLINYLQVLVDDLAHCVKELNRRIQCYGRQFAATYHSRKDNDDMKPRSTKLHSKFHDFVQKCVNEIMTGIQSIWISQANVNNSNKLLHRPYLAMIQ